MLEFELADEADAVGEAVRDEQDEPMEIEAAVLELGVVVVNLHVAREAGSRLARCRGRGSGLGRDFE